MCLRSPHVTALAFALSHLAYVPCFLCPIAVAICLTSETIFLLFIVDSFDHQCCGWGPRPALSFATVSIISFILRANSAFSTAIFTFHFWPVIMEGWAFFPSGSRESHSIWKSHALPNLNSSTNDNVGSFSFVDQLYSATFIKKLGTPDHFFNIFTD